MNTDPSPSDCVSEFLLVKRVERLQPKTLAGYEASLRMFLATPGLPASVRDLAPRHAMLWTATLADPDRCPALKPGAINAYQRPVWVWFRWLLDNDYLTVDIPRRVRRYKVSEADVQRRVVTDRLHTALLTKLGTRPEHPHRNTAIVEVLWYSGVRRSELAGLDLADVDTSAGSVTVRRGKGGKMRRVGLAPEACLAIERYLSQERGRKPGPLFLNRFGLRLQPGGVREVLRSLCEGEDFTVTSHDFRRACAANLRAGGMDIGNTMHQLGHSEPTMTLIYSASGEEEGALRAYHAVRPVRRKSG